MITDTQSTPTAIQATLPSRLAEMISRGEDPGNRRFLVARLQGGSCGAFCGNTRAEVLLNRCLYVCSAWVQAIILTVHRGMRASAQARHGTAGHASGYASAPCMAVCVRGVASAAALCLAGLQQNSDSMCEQAWSVAVEQAGSVADEPTAMAEGLSASATRSYDAGAESHNHAATIQSCTVRNDADSPAKMLGVPVSFEGDCIWLKNASGSSTHHQAMIVGHSTLVLKCSCRASSEGCRSFTQACRTLRY